MARITVEFSGQIKVDTQGWTDQTKLDQVYKQAQDQVDHWTIMIKKGGQEPIPVNFIKMKITEVTLPIPEK